MSFFENTRKPQGLGGKIMIAMMNSGHNAMADWGISQITTHPNTDVLDGCGKEAGMRWMLRTMSPETLVTDELGGALDVQAVMEASRSGVSIIATLHGRDLETALSRGGLYQLVQQRAFERYVLLESGTVGKAAAICDERLKPLAG